MAQEQIQVLQALLAVQAAAGLTTEHQAVQARQVKVLQEELLKLLRVNLLVVAVVEQVLLVAQVEQGQVAAVQAGLALQVALAVQQLLMLAAAAVVVKLTAAQGVQVGVGLVLVVQEMALRALQTQAVEVEVLMETHLFLAAMEVQAS